MGGASAASDGSCPPPPPAHHFRSAAALGSAAEFGAPNVANWLTLRHRERVASPKAANWLTFVPANLGSPRRIGHLSHSPLPRRFRNREVGHPSPFPTAAAPRLRSGRHSSSGHQRPPTGRLLCPVARSKGLRLHLRQLTFHGGAQWDGDVGQTPPMPSRPRADRVSVIGQDSVDHRRAPRSRCPNSERSRHRRRG